MAQYAYFQPFEGWSQQFPSGIIQTFDEVESVQLDCLTISEKEIALLRRRVGRVELYCPICQHRLFYNQGFEKQDKPFESRGSKSPYFYHDNRDACYFSESLAHALTKRFLFQRLQVAGYVVKEEKQLSINGRKLRADVAAYEGAEHKSRLRLVVEVLASHLTPGLIAKKVNAYHTEDVPIAWVLLLDDFFTGYGGTTKDVIDPVLGLTVRAPLEPGDDSPFTVIGGDSKAFMFLMDYYGFVLGVNYEGNIFLVRRDPINEDARIVAFMRQEDWTAENEMYKVCRIADKDIVRTLEMTPLIRMKEDEEARGRGVAGTVFGGSGEHTFTDDDGHLSGPEGDPIDFEGGMLAGSDADRALDPTALIREIWEAERMALLRFQQMEAEEKERKAEAERMALLRLQQMEAEERERKTEAERMASLRIQQMEDQKKAQMDEANRAHKEEEAQFLESAAAIDPGLNKAYTKSESESRGKQKREYASNNKVKDAETELRLRGYVLQNPVDILSLSANELEQLERFILGDPSSSSPVSLHRNEDTIWTTYTSLLPAERMKLERLVFPDGLPQWFASKKFKLERKEYEENKKRQLAEAKLKRTVSKLESSDQPRSHKDLFDL